MSMMMIFMDGRSFNCWGANRTNHGSLVSLGIFLVAVGSLKTIGLFVVRVPIVFFFKLSCYNVFI